MTSFILYFLSLQLFSCLVTYFLSRPYFVAIAAKSPWRSPRGKVLLIGHLELAKYRAKTSVASFVIRFIFGVADAAAAEAAASRPGGAPPAFSRIGACPPASARRGVGDAPARPQRGCGAALPPAFRGAAAARRTRSSRAARSPASGAFAATAVRSPVDQSGLRRRDSATATTTVATTATTRRRHFPRLSRGATTATARLHSFRTYGDAAAGRRVAMSAAAGSRATRDDDARHNTARHASGRRSRRPVPRRHTAIAPSRDSHDDRDAAAARGGVDVVGGGCGYGSTYCFGIGK